MRAEWRWRGVTTTTPIATMLTTDSLWCKCLMMWTIGCKGAVGRAGAGNVQRREEEPVSLTNVWVQTQGDGLVRADQIVGIEAHDPVAGRQTGPLAVRRGARQLDRQRHPRGLGHDRAAPDPDPNR